MAPGQGAEMPTDQSPPLEAENGNLEPAATTSLADDKMEPEALPEPAPVKKIIKKPRLIKKPQAPVDQTISLKTWTGDTE